MGEGDWQSNVPTELYINKQLINIQQILLSPCDLLLNRFLISFSKQIKHRTTEIVSVRVWITKLISNRIQEQISSYKSTSIEDFWIQIWSYKPSVSKSTDKFWKMSICEEWVMVPIEGVAPLLCRWLMACTPTYSTSELISGTLYCSPGSVDTYRCGQLDVDS